PDVIYIHSSPGNQPRILAALDPFANKLGNHGHRSRPRSGGLLGTQLGGGVLNCIDDVLIAGAAAEIAFECFTDLGVRRVLRALEQFGRGHDHARRAVAALEAMLFPETFLQGMQPALGTQTFNGGEVRALGLNRENRAGLHGPAVQMNRAGTAQRGLTPDMGAGQTYEGPYVTHQYGARIDIVVAMR